MQGKNQIFTKSGAVAYINEYYPFGLVNQQTSSTQFGSKEQRYKYNGKELMKDFGLESEDYGARLYSPQIGRWSLLDKMAHKYTSLSPYNFVANNPLKYIDPDGNDIKPSKAFTNSTLNPVYKDLYKNNSVVNSALRKFDNNQKFNLTLDISAKNISDNKAAVYNLEKYTFTEAGGKQNITSMDSKITFGSDAGNDRNNLGKAILVMHEALHPYSDLQGKMNKDDGRHQVWDDYLGKMEQAVTEYSKDNKLGLDATQIKELSLYNVGPGGDVYDNYVKSLAEKNKTDYKTENNAFIKRVNNLISGQ